MSSSFNGFIDSRFRGSKHYGGMIFSKEITMNDLWLLLIAVAVWYFLQGWLLPRLGIPTCLDQSCSVESRRKDGDGSSRLGADTKEHGTSKEAK